MKQCARCKETKPLDLFHNCSSKPGGKFSACKDCRNTANKAYAAKIGYDVLYARASKAPEYKEKQSARYAANPEPVKARTRAWGVANPEKKRESRKKHYQENKEQYIAQAAKWSASNPDARKAIANRHAKRFTANPENKPIVIARKLMSRVLSYTGRRKTGRTFDKLGYNKDALMEHIQKQFVDGMSWDNHGEWHVDHIVSVSELCKLGVTCPRKINALSNLRPMWAHENLSKSSGFDLAVQVAP